MSSAPGPRDVLSSRLLLGVAIAVLGALLLADNLGVVDARHVLRLLWPLVLVGAGVVMVRGPDHKRARAAGWVLITVGLWIFLARIGWLHWSLWDILAPALLLFVGGALVWRSVRGPQPEEHADGADHAEFVRSFAFLSGCELRPVSRPFRGADLNAVMGGLKLDLSDARMEGDSAVIDVFAFWGGVEIHVPPDWTVTTRVTTFLGGFIDKRRPTSAPPSKSLLVRGMIVMSGIEIKN
ncbi:MAG TPA: DUF5668 domain-containing protein [Steroidobacter sp.]|nr:DUF5668 domain-containing protein [Steroidobacteraceae bacterium]HLS80127.1 DUF5668 domain-containing protein [Steroidobacter sp.]